MVKFRPLRLREQVRGSQSNPIGGSGQCPRKSQGSSGTGAAGSQREPKADGCHLARLSSFEKVFPQLFLNPVVDMRMCHIHRVGKPRAHSRQLGILSFGRDWFISEKTIADVHIIAYQKLTRASATLPVLISFKPIWPSLGSNQKVSWSS